MNCRSISSVFMNILYRNFKKGKPLKEMAFYEESEWQHSTDQTNIVNSRNILEKTKGDMYSHWFR